MNAAKRMSEIRTGDKRLQAWLNEGFVLLALTKNDNEPTYVALIAKLVPKISRASEEASIPPDKAPKSKEKDEGGGTKPGMKAAAERLHKRGILIRTEAKTPNKKKKTPHYTITPSLDVLTTILRTYGSWVVEDMIMAGFAGALIEAGMDKHLSKVLKTSVESVRNLPKPVKDELSCLARSSTKAMEVFLDPQFELEPKGGIVKGNLGLIARLRRLRDAMLFAFIADVASSPGLKIWDEGWDVEVDVSTEIKFGNISIRLATKFDSKQFSREPENLDEANKTDKARREAPRGKPSS